MFNKKLELVVGAASESIHIELHDDQGKFIASLTDTSKSLKNLGVKNGMRIHATDISGENEALNDDSMVEKYTISDDKYDERKDTVRAWKRKLLARSSGEHTAIGTMESDHDSPLDIKIGDRCEVRLRNAPHRRGVVSFIGETEFREGTWVGVTYDEPVGKNDGSVSGVRYFHCNDKHGGFVRLPDVVTGDFPPLKHEDDMDEI
ncbi:CAP-Gly domain protein [Dictyocaulus viviparus]|uniref:CAP-Gly domain protein n=1 Tax=Dictyocaulus viviparus TaxID=29172 RepID=A0A0D8YBM6_DICVI|nr:CAP-Gly domain protein [Dictyocaulus viviparus]